MFKEDLRSEFRKTGEYDVDSLDLDRAIRLGIDRGRATRATRARGMRRFAAIGGAVMLALFAGVLTIRISPAFASAVRDIPGMKAFVDMINRDDDAGLKLAIRSDLMQPVNRMEEHEGIKMTVEGVLADEQRMVLFYELESARENEPLLRLADIRLKKADGSFLQASISYNSPDEFKQKEFTKGKIRGYIDVQMSGEEKLQDSVLVEAYVNAAPYNDMQKSRLKMNIGPLFEGHNALIGPFRIAIPIDKNKLADMTHVYDLKSEIIAEGQRITFGEASVSPLRVTVRLSYDDSNSKQVTGLGDIRLIDEDGTEWRNKGAFGQNLYFFESPYLRQPKKLFLEGSWFRAIDKAKNELIVDTEKGTLVRKPDDHIRLTGIDHDGDKLKLVFKLIKPRTADRMIYSLLAKDQFKDGAGYVYDSAEPTDTAAVFASDGLEQQISFRIDAKKYKQPLVFQLNDYPSYIEQPYRIQIPLS